MAGDYSGKEGFDGIRILVFTSMQELSAYINKNNPGGIIVIETNLEEDDEK
ncbi:MAG: hypothetical protein K6F77_05855 [Lachnospiraceae bacterium]|nr:hypothetical protein [Lachnospiraceae bacterium]